MATLHADVKDMPKVKKYLADQLPKVTGNQTVWTAFLKWSGYQIAGKPMAADASTAATTAVGGTGGPQVKLAATILADPNTANVGEANGIFYPKEPEILVIRIAIAEFYNKNIDSATYKDRANVLIESTVLHELVHYLNYKHHKKVRGFTEGSGADAKEIKEMGKRFEKDAYGRDIGSEGWWRQTAVAGAAIPQSIASHMQAWEGPIVKVELGTDKNVLVVKNKRKDGTEQDLRHELAPSVQVTIDDKPAKLADLKVGQRVRVTPLRVEALDKNADFKK
jgi:hypothetical protein